jgi:hypothetical protein
MTKMTVITDKSGNVVATYRHPSEQPKDAPVFRIGPGPDHKAHEIDLPPELDRTYSADELHRRLGEHLKGVAPKRQ